MCAHGISNPDIKVQTHGMCPINGDGSLMSLLVAPTAALSAPNSAQNLLQWEVNQNETNVMSHQQQDNPFAP